MNIRTRLCCLALVVSVSTVVEMPTATAVSPGHERCSALTPDRLPHTAEAIENWFRSCDTDRGDEVPTTADGASAWLNR